MVLMFGKLYFSICHLLGPFVHGIIRECHGALLALNYLVISYNRMSLFGLAGFSYQKPTSQPHGNSLHKPIIGRWKNLS